MDKDMISSYAWRCLGDYLTFSKDITLLLILCSFLCFGIAILKANGQRNEAELQMLSLCYSLLASPPLSQFTVYPLMRLYVCEVCSVSQI